MHTQQYGPDCHAKSPSRCGGVGVVWQEKNAIRVGIGASNAQQLRRTARFFDCDWLAVRWLVRTESETDRAINQAGFCVCVCDGLLGGDGFCWLMHRSDTAAAISFGFSKTIKPDLTHKGRSTNQPTLPCPATLPFLHCSPVANQRNTCCCSPFQL